MGHLEFIAVTKFAERLKIDFPVLLAPKDFADRMKNIFNEYAQKRIDLAVERVELERGKESLKEAKYFGKK